MKAAIAEPKTREEFDLETEELLGEQVNEQTGDWWCVRTSPFPCPAEGCDFIAVFLTAGHLVVVWPSKDDPALLRRAHEAKTVDRNPQVVKYRAEYGAAISWDRWQQIGRRVHGRIADPAGWTGAQF